MTMSCEDFKDEPTVFSQLKEQRAIAVDQLVAGVTLLAVVAVPVSISRALYTGWNHVYSVHIVLLMILISSYLLRAKLTVEQKSGIILSVGMLISLFGLVTYGLAGNGLLWGIFAILISIFFLKNKITYIVTIFIFSGFGIAAFQFVIVRKDFPGDADLYLAQPSSWGTAMVGSAFFIILISSLTARLRHQTDDLLLELERKNRELDEKNIEISRLADFDDLTGLPNIRHFKRTAEQALLQGLRENRFIAIGFLDLDGFKTVNDNFGHDAGDYILRSVAQRISTHIRQQDMVTRMGGDEFLVLINDDAEINLDSLFQRLHSCISEPYNYGSKQLNISVSIGVARLTSQNITLDFLLKQADNAMYEVKRQGKSNYLIT